ncbi:ribonuclease H-like domain-containing protein [Tanacetum coccineum]
MAVEDTTPPPPPPTDKSIPFSIPNKVPFKLDLEKHNYNSWISFSLIHLDLFHDNKDARELNLDNELRSIKIGKMTVNEYCTKIKSMADRLKNLGGEVSDKNLVIYTINGPDSRFATLVEIIQNRETFPSFETTRTMLLLKESSFNDSTDPSTTFDSSSSSPTVLMASTSPSNKGNTIKPSPLPQICNHFSRGTCKFGDRCKFIHDHRNRSGLNSQKNSSRGTVSSLPGIWNHNSTLSQGSPTHTQAYTRPLYFQPSPTAFVAPVQYMGPVTYPAQHHMVPSNQTQPLLGQHAQSFAHTAQHQPVYSGQPRILGLARASYQSQPTSILSAFSTMTLPDPTWNMDTGASSHLNSSTRNLSTIFNQRLFPSVHVGDGNSIPVTNIGHSIIPSLHCPLHLHNVLVTPNIVKNLISVCQFTRDNNCTIKFDAFGFYVKDFLTRHILLRCDSSGDLHPVTKSSTSPTAFLSTSASTWHQCLGHPGDAVLRSLISHRFISCNKEKAPHLCHACQLGKHVKLPFHSSDSIVENCFDIIHSDLWTYPIVSSSSFNYYVLFLDHFSHYLWIYPLRSKSDMFDKFLHFTYVKNQFKCEIKSFQCDHGDEFDNN